MSESEQQSFDVLEDSDTAEEDNEVEMLTEPDENDVEEPAIGQDILVPELSEIEKEALADRKKNEGNDFYQKKDYKNAVLLYTQAIEYAPKTAAYYGNRSAAYVMLEYYQKALDDARVAQLIDPTFVKAVHREGKCHMAMGEVVAAIVCYDKVLQLEPTHPSAKTDLKQAEDTQQYIGKGYKYYEEGEYRQVVFCMDRCIETCPACSKFKLLKAECLALLKRFQESQEIANDILRFDSMNADAVYVRGMCLYFQDNAEKAFQHFQQVLRLAPDHEKARTIYRNAKALMQKKEEGNTAFRCGQLKKAYELYSEALAIDSSNCTTNAKLYCNRAAVSTKLKNCVDAIADCTKAIELEPDYVKAYLRRANCYMESEQYEEAIRDYEKVNKLDKSHEHKRLLQEAKLELKKSKRKDYYKILGVTKTATDDEIKKAYRKRALLHHPDRHSHDTPEKQKDEEVKFKEIGEAYAVLSDPKKKNRYDSGQDLEEMMGGDAGNFDIDPNHIFQAFFSGASGFPSYQSGGFPGGFSFQFG